MYNIPSDVSKGDAITATRENALLRSMRAMATDMSSYGARITIRERGASGLGYAHPFKVSISTGESATGDAILSVSVNGGLWRGRGMGSARGYSAQTKQQTCIQTPKDIEDEEDLFIIPPCTGATESVPDGVAVILFAPNATRGVLRTGATQPWLYLIEYGADEEITSYATLWKQVKKFSACVIVGAWSIKKGDDDSITILDAPGQLLTSDYTYENINHGQAVELFGISQIEGTANSFAVQPGLLLVRTHVVCVEQDVRVVALFMKFVEKSGTLTTITKTYCYEEKTIRAISGCGLRVYTEAVYGCEFAYVSNLRKCQLDITETIPVITVQTEGGPSMTSYVLKTYAQDLTVCYASANNILSTSSEALSRDHTFTAEIDAYICGAGKVEHVYYGYNDLPVLKAEDDYGNGLFYLGTERAGQTICVSCKTISLCGLASYSWECSSRAWLCSVDVKICIPRATCFKIATLRTDCSTGCACYETTCTQKEIDSVELCGAENFFDVSTGTYSVCTGTEAGGGSTYATCKCLWFTCWQQEFVCDGFCDGESFCGKGDTFIQGVAGTEFSIVCGEDEAGVLVMLEVELGVSDTSADVSITNAPLIPMAMMNLCNGSSTGTGYKIDGEVSQQFDIDMRNGAWEKCYEERTGLEKTTTEEVSGDTTEIYCGATTEVRKMLMSVYSIVRAREMGTARVIKPLGIIWKEPQTGMRIIRSFTNGLVEVEPTMKLRFAQNPEDDTFCYEETYGGDFEEVEQTEIFSSETWLTSQYYDCSSATVD